MDVLAKIGSSGQKVHKVTVDALNTVDGYIIWGAYSQCGSQKWSYHGKSPIFVLESNDLKQVDCDKCLGIRTVGGKTPPASKRKVIDPDSRPKQFRFKYKADYWGTPLHSNEISFGREGAVFTETVRGMTEDEAWEKLVKQEVGPREKKFFSRIYDKELIAIYAWNDRPLWRKSDD